MVNPPVEPEIDGMRVRVAPIKKYVPFQDGDTRLE